MPLRSARASSSSLGLFLSVTLPASSCWVFFFFPFFQILPLLVPLRSTPSPSAALDAPHVAGGRARGRLQQRPFPPPPPFPTSSPPGRLPEEALRAAGPPPGAPLSALHRPAAGLAPPRGARSRPLRPAGPMGPDGPDSPARTHLAESFTIAAAPGGRRRQSGGSYRRRALPRP